MLIALAAGSTTELAAGRFQDATRRSEYDIIGRGSQQVRDHGLDLTPELRQHPRLRLARLRQHHQAFRARSRIRAAKDRHTPPAQTSDIAQGVFQFMRINVASSPDDDVLGAARQVHGCPHHIRQVSRVQPGAMEETIRGLSVVEIATGR